MPLIERLDEKSAGFTLVETVVAFAILSLALTAAVRTISVGMHNAQRAQAELQMRQIARAVLSEQLPYQSGVDQGQWDDNHRWRLEVEPLSGELGHRLRRVTLEVTRKAAPKLSSTYLSFDGGR